mmetsp:Transcript_4356/g.10204  ORF Transcript_4356/g.10204 Transcript_4356/m.10204 type:complete len:212 (+) Transcript_4356:1114-1749(+)
MATPGDAFAMYSDMRLRASSSTSSFLFSSTTSAHASCDLTTPSGTFASPVFGIQTSHCSASTTVTTQSSRARYILPKVASSERMIECGSVTPEVSMTRYSIRPTSTSLSSIDHTALSRSFEREQQTQPFESSTTRSAALPVVLEGRFATRSPSMLSSAKSLTAAATLRLCLFARMWRISVVFPAPRKPVTIVTGRGRFRFAPNTSRFSARR